MKELSLNILDIAKNSVKAKATQVCVTLNETDDTFEMIISDNGCGMKQDFLKTVTDPFSTTRTTRKVGMGIPFLKLAAEQTGGSFGITSVHESESEEHGTETRAFFHKNSVDFTPLGDIISTVITLIQGSPDIRWIFRHSMPDKEVALDTDELRAVLGDDVPLDNIEVIMWIKGYLEEAYAQSE
ncbi:MAG: sensor histidine kinase [Clostridia bacterium]|nr:sensor histidine kinase [Clostridia bacterium]